MPFGHSKRKESKQMKSSESAAKEEMEFWENLLPPGWQLHGFNHKKLASAWGPNYKFAELNADFLLAFKEWILSSNPTPTKESPND